MIRRWGITILILLLISPIWGQDYSIPISIGLNSGVLVEKGETSSRTLLFSAINLSIITELNSGNITSGITYSRGSFLGSTDCISLNVNYAVYITDHYSPSIGIVMDLEYGDYIFFSTGSTYLPPETSIYAGINLQPLLFKLGNYYVSTLDFSLMQGINARVPFRSKLSLFNLGIQQSNRQTKESTDITIEFSTGADVGLAENIWLSFLSVPDIRLDIGNSFFGWGLQIQNLQAREELSDFWGYRILSDIYIAGDFHAWKPALGMGVFYSEHAILHDPSYGLYGLIRPLKFRLAYGNKISIFISLVEFKFGSLLPEELDGYYQSGAFLIQCAPIRFGVSVKI